MEAQNQAEHWDLELSTPQDLILANPPYVPSMGSGAWIPCPFEVRGGRCYVQFQRVS